MKLLRRTQFGNPILRMVAGKLTLKEIKSAEIQELIANMYYTVQTKKYGVGLAAPQVGEGIALAIINIRPTAVRPEAESFKLTIINPEVINTYGRRSSLWEGCISLGGSKDSVFARVPRYKKIRLRYHDEKGLVHERDFDGLAAHVIQHEVDHLDGVLFVDRVKDTSTYVTLAEYKRRYRD